MKKIFAIVMALVLAISLLTACDDGVESLEEREARLKKQQTALEANTERLENEYERGKELLDQLGY